MASAVKNVHTVKTVKDITLNLTVEEALAIYLIMGNSCGSGGGLTEYTYNIYEALKEAIGTTVFDYVPNYMSFGEIDTRGGRMDEFYNWVKVVKEK